MSEVKELEHQLEETKLYVERAEKIHKLFANHEFRELVIEQFCTKDCARYVQESADPLLTAAQRADALALAQAAGHFKRYFAIQLRQAEVAAREVPNIEEALNELRASEEHAD